jgi:AhpD family alkylhydroperoxidase
MRRLTVEDWPDHRARRALLRPDASYGSRNSASDLLNADAGEEYKVFDSYSYRRCQMIEERQAVDRDIEETLGLVPEFFERVPDYLLPTEWASFKSLQLSDETAIPNKYKELIGLAVSGATRCRYCVYFHTEAARLFGATEAEIVETALISKNTMGWSTYLNTLQSTTTSSWASSTRSPLTCASR